MANRSQDTLVVDGDSAAGREIAAVLSDPPFQVRLATTGAEGLELAAQVKPDLVVTELVLPDVTGLGLCRVLRERARSRDVGILMVSSRAEEIDRILAFEAGVDDFLPKPFYGRELASRARALLRRSSSLGSQDLIDSQRAGEPVVMNPRTGVIEVKGRRIDLTPREFDLLATLIRESGRVVTRSQLLNEVWGERADPMSRVVDAHVKAIRRKLGDAKECLETVRGIGYRLSDLRS